MQYSYFIKLTDNLLTIYYVASACLNDTTVVVHSACCSDIAVINASNGRKMICNKNISHLTLEEVRFHYKEHDDNNQTFFWKDLSQVAKHLQPYVNSVFTSVKNAVGKFIFV